MNLRQLQGKEIINLATGEKLGLIAEVELTFEQETGNLNSLLIPVEKGIFDFLGEEHFLEIPWDSIVKIGAEVIVINLGNEE
ncbi:YlmC/YmxH family sporulation protein [Halanaerobacter jeridensis]|uniref:YlmC/YmxH family sporulation protein n=1 Tax=Halanaerobacter jeridensis TaxID=706427 RepID=A0A939BQ61_9FIRM|nr:YlmC/YmxH family sporulation protein [Halanaerobacter jeridensis]